MVSPFNDIADFVTALSPTGGSKGHDSRKLGNPCPFVVPESRYLQVGRIIPVTKWICDLLGSHRLVDSPMNEAIL